MNNIYGITVSKNYSDFLYFSIKKNHTLFRKWYIVTQEDDEDTIALINNFNLDNIELVFYPLVPDLCLPEHQQMPFIGDDAFLTNDNPNLRLLPPKYKKVIFDKGGAIRFVQSKLLNNLSNFDFVISIDSDILIPEDFQNHLHNCTLKNDTLYGCWRIDYDNYNDFTEAKNAKRYYRNNMLDGYFQGYLYDSKYLFKRSITAAYPDTEFKKQFCREDRHPDEITARINSGIEVFPRHFQAIHLGEGRKNWRGRKTKKFSND